MNLCEPEKNQAFSSFCFRNILDLKILQSDWSRAFWVCILRTKFLANMEFVQEYRKQYKLSL